MDPITAYTTTALTVGSTVAAGNGAVRFFPWLRQSLFELIFDCQILVCKNNNSPLFVSILAEITRDVATKLTVHELHYDPSRGITKMCLSPVVGERLDMVDFYIESVTLDGKTTGGFKFYSRKSKRPPMIKWIANLMSKNKELQQAFLDTYGIEDTDSETTRLTNTEKQD